MIMCASKTNMSGDIYVKLTQSTNRKSTCLTVPDNWIHVHTYTAVLCLLFLAKCIIHSVVIWNHIHVTLYEWHLSEYHGGQFYYWRKTEYPEKTSDMSQVTDKLYQIWVTYIVSYKKQELLTLREHLSLPSVFWWVAYLPINVISSVITPYYFNNRKFFVAWSDS
jgi:hypothetical protein